MGCFPFRSFLVNIPNRIRFPILLNERCHNRKCYLNNSPWLVMAEVDSSSFTEVGLVLTGMSSKKSTRFSSWSLFLLFLGAYLIVAQKATVYFNSQVFTTCSSNLTFRRWLTQFGVDINLGVFDLGPKGMIRLYLFWSYSISQASS